MSLIQITVETMKMISPTTEKIQSIVVPITISVIPIAQTNGISDGPGRWISSPPAGVVCGLEFAHGWT